MTPIYHLNVKFFVAGSNPIGTFDSHTLLKWKEEYTIIEVLKDAFCLFFENNEESPYDYRDSGRRKEFLNNRNLFRKKALYFSKKYANSIITKNDWDFTFNE